MSKRNLLAVSLVLALFQIMFAGKVNAQLSNPRIFTERFVVQSVRTIHSAEATYQATTGNGMYGTLAELRQANLIDAALAGGEKYGYHFVLSKTNPTATMPAKFQLTATPRIYPKSGHRSFYIDQRGDIYGADKNGEVATSRDWIIDDCSLYGDSAANERCAILALRTYYSAQITYFNAVGTYGDLADLQLAGLIRPSLGGAQFHGYYFLANRGYDTQYFFYFQAVPDNYRVSGRRSFHIGMDGIVRGADHRGQYANENDPPVED
jgi:hypothetical protein